MNGLKGDFVLEENKKLYELTKIIRDKSGMEEDMFQAFAGLRDAFGKKYLTKLHTVADIEQQQAHGNPSREVKLLRVLKEFMPQENHNSVNSIIETLLFLHTANHIHQEIGTVMQNDLPVYINSNDPDAAQTAAQTEQENEMGAKMTELMLTLAMLHKI